MDKTWAIVLAAGESKRMGRPKMLLPFKDSTMIGNVISNIHSSGIDNILVVLGSESASIISVIQGFSVNFCINESFKEGMLSSIICGLDNLPGESGSVLIQPGDQPLIESATISKLMNEKHNSGYGIVVPVCNKKRGHPVIIDRKYSDEIRRLDKDKGLRSLLDIYSHDVKEMKTEDTGVLKDFDTYEEYLDEIHLK